MMQVYSVGGSAERSSMDQHGGRSTPRKPWPRSWICRRKGRRFRGALALISLVVLASTWGCSPGCANRSAGESSAAKPAEAIADRTIVDVFAFGRVLGTVAPCGCTSDPLGGLAYAFGMIEKRSKADARIVVEPGSFLFPDPQGPEAPRDEAAWAQALQRADLLQKRFGALGQALAGGIGPSDFSSPQGAAALDRWPIPRTLGNLEPSARTAWPRLATTATVELGSGLQAVATTLVDPALATSDGFPAVVDPIAAVESLALPDAALRIALVQGPRSLAETVAKTERFHLVVMGGPLDDAERGRTGSSAVLMGKTWVLEPGDRAQTVTHVRLSLASNNLGEATAWSVTPPRATLEQQRARVLAQLTKFRDDPSADKAFVARLDAELAELDAALAGNSPANNGPAVAVTFEQVNVRCTLPEDPEAAEGLDAYDAWIADTNKKRFAGVRPPEPAQGHARYVGDDECSTCHDEAKEFWLDTRHAQAFATLERSNKQYDVDCVGCHVTGFRRPGGSEVVENAGLRDVQCEQCHGPGSLHADEPTDASDRPLHIERSAPIEVCLECHTPEHSDTFDYEAYLRDVLGPGHGARAREGLGDGPTGRQLRSAAIEKAGGSCTKK